MSFKMTRVASHSISPPSKQPEVITIPDSDEEESQDLFDSAMDEKNDSVEVVDSDDLFSCSGSEAGSPVKKSSAKLLPSSRVQLSSSKNRSIRQYLCKKPKRTSSVIVSPRKSLSPRVAWRRSPSDGYVSKKDPLVITIDDNVKDVKTEENIVDKPKSDEWAKKHLEEMARKLEKRDRIMTELVRKDKDFLNIVHGGALEHVQKKTKEKLVEGDVVRKQADRAKMRGVVHPSSEAYFDALELSPESKERRINEVSRVRVVAEKMPSTPENYWEVGTNRSPANTSVLTVFFECFK
ncbi:hypothetical protein Y032_0251g192 [Ancylostoma ceylanicum]|uniref:Uncharacterized protein n=3 Tax=Ancylostoma ceylanicum TaxID=53326 RepID=A0A016SC11_9BILA|nr:hypothetical protein Y032_0251g192 [Ancylostoma ceylanicum]